MKRKNGRVSDKIHQQKLNKELLQQIKKVKFLPFTKPRKNDHGIAKLIEAEFSRSKMLLPEKEKIHYGIIQE